MAKIAPSLLSADFSRLGEEVARVTEAGADIIHFDVMDGHFVPNLTFGPMVLKAIRRFSHLPFEAHLMITHPQTYWRAFADAGADVVGIHIEAALPHLSLIEEIRKAGKKTCIVVNPPTEVERILPVLDRVDEVLVMTVNPGFGGQSFIGETVPKIKFLAEYRERKRLEFSIEVDGGINVATARQVKDAGADILVAGSFVFASKDYRAVIEELRWS